MDIQKRDTVKALLAMALAAATADSIVSVALAGTVKKLTLRVRGGDQLQITRDEVRKSEKSSGAAIVSAGLSDMGAKEADRQGMERLDPAEVITLLQARGMDQLVDAYGIHIYPARKDPKAIESVVTKLLDFCKPSESGRPCWVTEWGIANTARTCPVDDRERLRAMAAMRTVFSDLAKAKRLDAAYYYDWDTQQSYRLWRCGSLSPAGALAIAPGTGDPR